MHPPPLQGPVTLLHFKLYQGSSKDCGPTRPVIKDHANATDALIDFLNVKNEETKRESDQVFLTLLYLMDM